MSNQSRLIPIYTTSGDLGAFLVYPYIFNQIGEWIGWATADRQVYSIYGKYAGWLGEGPRILRKRVYDHKIPDLKPPDPPGRISVQSTVPLAPLMPEITYSTIDVLEDYPELLPTKDDFAFVDDLD